MESETKHAALTSRLTVAVTGASGLVGSALCVAMKQRGWSALRIVRRADANATAALAADEIAWEPTANKWDAARLNGVDAVVHLAGENIAGGRWTAALKQRIRDSRVVGTKLLAESLAQLDRPPRVLVSASAIGYYGNRADALLAEEHGPGHGFLPDVCVEWEQATAPATARGIRVVNLRIGIVLSAKGGALQKMLLPFRLGVGGRVGSGGQFWSWISLPDLVGVILHAITTDSLAGPVNTVSPEAVTNREFTQTLGSVLHRPTIIPMPAFAARLAFGEMADGLMLASARVFPFRLQATGYPFQHPNLRAALQDALST